MKLLKLKRYLSLLLALALAFTLTACGNRTDPPAVDATPDSTTQPVGSAESTPPAQEDGSTTESGDPSLDGTVESTEQDDRTTATTADTSYPYDPTGTTLSLSPDMMLVDNLLRLPVGESRSNVTLKGTVTHVKSINGVDWDATFTIRVDGGYSGDPEILCYRVKPAKGTALQVAAKDVLILKGTVQNYKGTIQFHPAEYTNTHPSGGHTTVIKTDGKGTIGTATHTGVNISGNTKPTTTTTTQAKPTYSPATGTHTTAAPSADKVLVDQLFTLSTGASRDNITLSGIVTNVKEVSESHGNATFTLQVQSTDGFREIYCYRVKPTTGTALAVAVGDNLTLSGTVQNYKGTIEFYPAEFIGEGGTVVTTTTTTRQQAGDGAIDPDGVYTTKEDVALYLHTYGRLPQNFITKSQYRSLGEPRDKCCGGDRFYNKEGLLPNKAGRLYYECDIDTLGKTSRGAKRIVYSNDGLIYYTGDHYGSFTLMYGTP